MKGAVRSGPRQQGPRQQGKGARNPEAFLFCSCSLLLLLLLLLCFALRQAQLVGADGDEQRGWDEAEALVAAVSASAVLCRALGVF